MSAPLIHAGVFGWQIQALCIQLLDFEVTWVMALLCLEVNCFAVVFRYLSPFFQYDFCLFISPLSVCVRETGGGLRTPQFLFCTLKSCSTNYIAINYKYLYANYYILQEKLL